MFGHKVLLSRIRKEQEELKQKADFETELLRKLSGIGWNLHCINQTLEKLGNIDNR